jgi:hypothetical protein
MPPTPASRSTEVLRIVRSRRTSARRLADGARLDCYWRGRALVRPASRSFKLLSGAPEASGIPNTDGGRYRIGSPLNGLSDLIESGGASPQKLRSVRRMSRADPPAESKPTERTARQALRHRSQAGSRLSAVPRTRRRMGASLLANSGDGSSGGATSDCVS